MTEIPVSATKNFYIVWAGSASWGEGLLAAWFNPTFFLGCLLLAGRQVGGRWTRFPRSDFASMPVSSHKSCLEELRLKARSLIESLEGEILSDFREQMNPELRDRIDSLAAEMLGLHGAAARETIDEIQEMAGDELDRTGGT